MLTLAVVCLLAAVQPADAIVGQNDYPYAVVCLKNFTDVPVYYSFRWGNSGQWDTREIEPGGSHWHSYTYEPGSRVSPDLIVKFNSNLASGSGVKEYALDRYAVKEQVCELGKGYEFVREGNGIDLQKGK
jgi:hypothetical protein